MPRSKLEWQKCLRGADLTHAQYRVLMGLSTYADGKGNNARPGADRLADDCGMTRSNVHRILKQLRESGWIEVQVQGGNHVRKGWATVYSLSVPKGITTTPKGVMSTPEGSHSDTPSGHRPDHLNHSEDSASASPASQSPPQKIQPSTRDWSNFFHDFDVLQTWFDKHVPGWDHDHVAESAAHMMWEDERHPKAIIEYVLSRHGMKLAA